MPWVTATHTKKKYKKLIFFLIEKYFRVLIPQWHTISWIIPRLRSISHHLVQQNNWREEYKVQTWRIRPGCCFRVSMVVKIQTWEPGRMKCTREIVMNGIPQSPKSSKTSSSFFISSCSAPSQGTILLQYPQYKPSL